MLCLHTCCVRGKGNASAVHEKQSCEPLVLVIGLALDCAGALRSFREAMPLRVARCTLLTLIAALCTALTPTERAR